MTRDLVGNLDRIAKVRQELNARRIKFCIITITGEKMNLGFNDARLKQLYRFSANLNLTFIGGTTRGEAGHSGHETGVGIGQAQDRKGHVLTLSYVLKRKKIV